MKTTPVEQLFYEFDETAQILQEELSCTYLDALVKQERISFMEKSFKKKLVNYQEKIREILSPFFGGKIR